MLHDVLKPLFVPENGIFCLREKKSWLSMPRNDKGTCFSWKIWQLKVMPLEEEAEVREKKAWDIFGFSLIYLACAFFTLVIDSVCF